MYVALRGKGGAGARFRMPAKLVFRANGLDLIGLRREERRKRFSLFSLFSNLKFYLKNPCLTRKSHFLK
jgi:hypothetical protein